MKLRIGLIRFLRIIFAVMDYLKLYRRFVYSHYFSEGVRMSMGVLLPALVCGYYGYLQKGIFISLGALCVSITDNPGPIHHRRNGMLACCGCIGLMAVLTGLTFHIPWLFLIVLALSCFIFSMIGVYGARVTAVGMSSLLVMVMLTHQSLATDEIGLFVLLLMSGGVWYMLLSLILNRLQPYKLIQQVLGEYILSAGNYLRTRAAFYRKSLKGDTAYQNLMQMQVAVQQKQEMVAELLFKTRGFVKESSNIGRVLMMTYLDVSDLLERAMTAHFDYNKLHAYFDDTTILDDYQHAIEGLATELEIIGVAVISRKRSQFSPHLETQLEEVREHLAELRKERLNPNNLEGFISLRQILDSILDIAARLRTLHRYTHYDKEQNEASAGVANQNGLVFNQDYSWHLLIDNLSWKSNIFRHSIRVTLAALVAYTGGLYWSLGHSYWILLTVIFILKPGFGLTRLRNKQRIIGTVGGTVIAGGLLYFISNHYVILVLLTVCMIIGYTFMRWKYLVSIFFMTIYLLLMFHLIEPANFNLIVRDRVIDTVIGGAIAVIAMLAIPAVWEKVQMSSLLRDVINTSTGYFNSVAFVFTGKAFDKTLNIASRKAAWVALANLSDAFNRMLSEPKTHQVNSREWHRVLVSSHMMVSHTATLSSFAQSLPPEYVNQDYAPIIRSTISKLDRITSTLGKTNLEEDGTSSTSTGAEKLSTRLQQLIATRQQELEKGLLETNNKSFLSTFKTITDQFYFIQNAANDIEKLSGKLSDTSRI